jgi:DNA-binding transcriptional ArsR family regulator
MTPHAVEPSDGTCLRQSIMNRGFRSPTVPGGKLAWVPDRRGVPAHPSPCSLILLSVTPRPHHAVHLNEPASIMRLLCARKRRRDSSRLFVASLEQAVLAFLLENVERSYYSVELSDDAGLSRGGVNQALHALDEAGLVLTEDIGVKRLYRANRTGACRAPLNLSDSPLRSTRRLLLAVAREAISFLNIRAFRNPVRVHASGGKDTVSTRTCRSLAPDR